MWAKPQLLYPTLLFLLFPITPSFYVLLLWSLPSFWRSSPLLAYATSRCVFPRHRYAFLPWFLPCIVLWSCTFSGFRLYRLCSLLIWGVLHLNGLGKSFSSRCKFLSQGLRSHSWLGTSGSSQRVSGFWIPSWDVLYWLWLCGQLCYTFELLLRLLWHLCFVPYVPLHLFKPVSSAYLPGVLVDALLHQCALN